MHIYDFLRKYDGRMVESVDHDDILILDVDQDGFKIMIDFFYTAQEYKGRLEHSSFLELVPALQCEYDLQFRNVDNGWHNLRTDEDGRSNDNK